MFIVPAMQIINNNSSLDLVAVADLVADQILKALKSSLFQSEGGVEVDLRHGMGIPSFFYSQIFYRLRDEGFNIKQMIEDGQIYFDFNSNAFESEIFKQTLTAYT